MAGKAVALALEYFLQPALRLDLVDHSFGEGGIRRGGDVRAGSNCHRRREQVEDVCAACGHVELSDHTVDLSSNDVLAGSVIADHVAVAGQVDVNVAVRTAQNHQDGAVVLDAGIHIAVPVLAQRSVLDELAFGDGLGTLPPLEDAVHIVPGLVLLGGAAFAREYTAGVAWESAGHVDADGAVTLLLGSLEEEFGAVIDLGNAACRKEERDALLVAVQTYVLLAREAPEVMVVEENEDVVRVGVEHVVGHRHVNVEESRGRAVGGVVGLRERIGGEEGQVEIHHGLEVRIVDRVEGRIVLPPGREAASYWIPSLAGDVEVGVFLHCLLAPAGAEFGVHVRMSVLAHSVDAGVFYPPDAVLDEVVGDQRIALVQVGHSLVEPTVGEEPAL